MRTICALLALVCAILAAPALATGGYYGADGRYHEAEEGDLCEDEGHGPSTGSRDGTTGLKWTEDGQLVYWHETIHTCENGAEVSTWDELGEPFDPPGNMKPPVVPNAEYVPDPVPPDGIPRWAELGYESECEWLAAGGG